jgi:peptidoglycan-N-acetylglucosamine deacetylase
MHQKIAYLTIDDGPTEDFADKLEFLESKTIKAIWLCVGKRLLWHRQAAILAITKGHIIGNHSYSHPHFSQISLEEAKREILSTDRIIEEIYQDAGIRRPLKVFRFPHLDKGTGKYYNNFRWGKAHVRRIQRFLRELGYQQPNFKGVTYRWYRRAKLAAYADIACSYDTLDWVVCANKAHHHGYHDLESLLRKIDKNLPEEGHGINYPSSNEVITMHAGVPMDVFESLITKFVSKGLKFQLPLEASESLGRKVLLSLRSCAHIF